MHNVSLTYETIDITPVMAGEILANQNPNNRKVNDIQVRRYTKSMLANEWTMNGDTISFDSEGNLFDGQHRLKAVIDSSKTITFSVIRGILKDTALGTKDTGKVRSDADYLTMTHGVPQTLATQVADAMSRLAAWRRANAVVIGTANKLNSRDVGLQYEENRIIVNHALQWKMDNVPKYKSLLPNGIMLFIIIVILEADENIGDKYLQHVLASIGLEKGTTAFEINDLLQRWKNKEQPGSVAERINTVFKGWEYFRQDRNCTKRTLRWKKGDELPTV